MVRNRAYTRKMRAKAIKRKKRITSHYWSADTYPYYPHDGMYSKNKVHCSCALCKDKAYYGKHLLTAQELTSILKLKEELDAYNEIFGTSYELILEDNN
jgi:hypothetical protein